MNEKEMLQALFEYLNSGECPLPNLTGDDPHDIYMAVLDLGKMANDALEKLDE